MVAHGEMAGRLQAFEIVETAVLVPLIPTNKISKKLGRDLTKRISPPSLQNKTLVSPKLIVGKEGELEGGDEVEEGGSEQDLPRELVLVVHGFQKC